jgi:hypothetical protein
VSTPLRRENRLVFGSLAVPLVMTNPPIIGWVSDYAAAEPVLLGQPTVWLWLQFWYVVMLGLFVWFAVRLPSWQTELVEEELERTMASDPDRRQR